MIGISTSPSSSPGSTSSLEDVLSVGNVLGSTPIQTASDPLGLFQNAASEDILGTDNNGRLQISGGLLLAPSSAPPSASGIIYTDGDHLYFSDFSSWYQLDQQSVAATSITSITAGGGPIGIIFNSSSDALFSVDGSGNPVLGSIVSLALNAQIPGIVISSPLVAGSSSGQIGFDGSFNPYLSTSAAADTLGFNIFGTATLNGIPLLRPDPYYVTWTANGDDGDITSVIPDNGTTGGLAAALDGIVSGVGDWLQAVSQKVKALEYALSQGFYPNA